MNLRTTAANFLLDSSGNGRYPAQAVLRGRRQRSARQTRMAAAHLAVSETILQALPCGCVVIDRQGLVQSANPAACCLLDLPPEQVLGRPLLDVVPAWQRTQLADALPLLLAVLSTNGVQEFELPAPNERWLRACVSRLPDDQGLVLMLLDTTELAKLKQRLRLTEYQASIGKLARGIAHELNNPLDGVLRYTHLALEQLTEETPVREYLLHVKEGLDRMVRAVRAFLEFSRQATTPVNRLADLNRLIEDALVLFQHRAKFQHIRIITNFDGTLPPVPDGGLQHAVVNVIKNAFDVMSHNGTLTITTRQSDGQVQVDIEDSGSGIPEDIRPRIFEPFFSTKPIHQGTGLGLVIAKEVVERSGGTIDCTSQVGVGTTFRILIPVETAHDGT